MHKNWRHLLIGSFCLISNIKHIRTGKRQPQYYTDVKEFPKRGEGNVSLQQRGFAAFPPPPARYTLRRADRTKKIIPVIDETRR